MPAITHATITAFYLFDVAEQIDLTALRAAIGGGAINARLTTKSAAPSYLQYSVPPVVVDGDALDIAESTASSCASSSSTTACSRWRSRGRLPASGPALLDLSQIYIENAELERRAEAIARRIVERFAAVVKRGRATFLSEDYLVVSITRARDADDRRGPPGGARQRDRRSSSAASGSRSAARNATR